MWQWLSSRQLIQKLRPNLNNLEIKYVSLATVLVSFLLATSIFYMKRYLFQNIYTNIENKASLISESTATSFTNTLLYEELELIEEGGLLDNQISDLLMSENILISEIVVLNTKGSTISASNHEWYDNLHNLELLGLKNIPEKMSSQKINKSDIRQLLIINPLRIYGKSFGVLAIYYSLEIELSKIAKMEKRLYLVAFFILICSIIIAAIVAKVLSTPIKNLAGEMTKVTDASYKPNFNSNRMDEIGLLERGFIDMLTRLREADQNMQESQIALIRAEKMAAVGKLSAGLAHEINNPLGGIKTCINRIKNDPENISQIVKYCELMQDALAQIERMLHGLLDYTSMESPALEKLYINDSIKSVVNFLKYPAELKKINLIASLDTTNHVVMGNKQQLKQVFTNLILNSIDAIDTEGEITIKSSCDEKIVRVTLHDDGEGIPPDTLPYIFDPFYTTKPHGKGTGLGLAICNNIILAHNAKLRCESKERHGTVFLIEFPMLSSMDSSLKET